MKKKAGQEKVENNDSSIISNKLHTRTKSDNDGCVAVECHPMFVSLSDWTHHRTVLICPYNHFVQLPLATSEEKLHYTGLCPEISEW